MDLYAPRLRGGFVDDRQLLFSSVWALGRLTTKLENPLALCLSGPRGPTAGTLAPSGVHLTGLKFVIQQLSKNRDRGSEPLSTGLRKCVITSETYRRSLLPVMEELLQCGAPHVPVPIMLISHPRPEGFLGAIYLSQGSCVIRSYFSLDPIAFS